MFGLGADVIAGFPGETDRQHQATMDFIARLPFTYLHVFPFSVRPDAPAARLSGQLPAAVVRQRAQALRSLGDAKATAYRTSRQGGRADAVICGHQEGRVEALTQDYLTVYLTSHEWDGRPRLDLTVP
jgi:threonylcarbamoyladenosine tRNA methylthiotransferase MtaB